MLGFPKSTEFNKRIPKQKFYEHSNNSAITKKLFVDQIEEIVWRNKISPSTINIANGEIIKEFEIIEIKLKEKNFSTALFKQIEKMIPYKCVYVFSFGNMQQLWLQFSEKEIVKTEWNNKDNYIFSITGFNLDTVWENLAVQIGDITIEEGNTVDEQIELNKKREQIEKEIARLEKQARKETQPKKKFELVQKIKVLKEEMINEVV